MIPSSPRNELGDVDDDERDEVVWATSNVDHGHCALVLMGAAPGAAALSVRTTIRLDESRAPVAS